MGHINIQLESVTFTFQCRRPIVFIVTGENFVSSDVIILTFLLICDRLPLWW